MGLEQREVAYDICLKKKSCIENKIYVPGERNRKPYSSRINSKK